MTKECEGQLGLVADLAERFVNDQLSLTDGARTEVGEFAAFQVRPKVSIGSALVR